MRCFQDLLQTAPLSRSDFVSRDAATAGLHDESADMQALYAHAVREISIRPHGIPSIAACKDIMGRCDICSQSVIPRECNQMASMAQVEERN